MTSTAHTQQDPRFIQMQQWLQSAVDSPAQAIEAAAADASVRRYWRVQFESGSQILMDAPSEGFNFAQFLAQHQRLKNAGAPVPTLHAYDAVQGFALMEDLGNTTLSVELNEANAAQYYKQAIDLMLDMQLKVDVDELPAYDADFLRRELAICEEWYFAQQLGITLQDEAKATWDRSCALIVLRNLAQAKTYVHRDFHSRNLMLHEGQLRLLDFQDAVYGPISYDLVSLLRDAYVDWDEAFVLDLVIYYWEKARAAGLAVEEDFGEFYRSFEWQGLQRHLKVLGIFARLKYRDGKTQYQADIPRVLWYVKKVCERYVELGALRRLLATVHAEQIDVGYTF